MRKLRTQIQLDGTDHAALRQYVYRHGLSMAAAVRQILRTALGDQERFNEDVMRNFLKAAGSCTDREGRRDVARHHDRYLYEKDDK